MKEKVRTLLLIFWNWFKKRSWYIILLCASSIYVFYYRYEIYQLKEINAQNLIFLLWIVLLLLPLFSEMEFLGVKIKKVVENANKEIKDDVRKLEMQVAEIKLTNNIANTIHIGNGALPSEEKIEELLRLVQSMKVESGGTNHLSKNELPEDKAVYLFTIRLEIEKKINEILEKTSFDTVKPIGLIGMVRWLHNSELMDNNTAHLLIEVIKIANRGVHGEIVSDEYIRFIQNAYPEILAKLKDCLNIVTYRENF